MTPWRSPVGSCHAGSGPGRRIEPWFGAVAMLVAGVAIALGCSSEPTIDGAKQVLLDRLEVWGRELQAGL